MTRAGGFTGLLFLLAVLTVGGGSCGGQDDMLNTEQFQLSPNSWSNDNTLIACPECESGCLDCLACQNRCERDCETDASCSDPEPCLDQCRQGVVCRDCSICMFNCHYWSEPCRTCRNGCAPSCDPCHACQDACTTRCGADGQCLGSCLPECGTCPVCEECESSCLDRCM